MPWFSARLLAARLLAALLMTAGTWPGVSAARAADTYQTPDDFLADVFPGGVPPAQVLWLTGDLRTRVAQILGAPPPPRVRYWQQGQRSAWILDAIGKDQPITAGIVLEAAVIRDVRVLVFRESRGWEVRQPFFTRQFDGALLDPQGNLNSTVDGITGATLSVRAMTRMATIALLLGASRGHTAAVLATSP